MLHSDSVQHAVDAREDSDVLRCSAWLLACALLLQEQDQPSSPRPAQQGRIKSVSYTHLTLPTIYSV